MTTVWKFPLMTRSAVGLNPLVEIPKGAQVIDVAVHDDTVFAWALVDAATAGTTEKRQFRLRQTGSEIDFDLTRHRFVGSAALFTGQLVFHIWEERRPHTGVATGAEVVRMFDERVDQMEKRLAGLEHDFPTQVGTTLAALREKVENLESLLGQSDNGGQVQPRLDTIEDTLSSPGTAQGGLDALRSMLQQQIVAVEERVKALEQAQPKGKAK